MSGAVMQPEERSWGVNALAMALLLASALLLWQPLMRPDKNESSQPEAVRPTLPEKMPQLHRVVVLPDPVATKPLAAQHQPSGHAHTDVTSAHTPAIEASFAMPVLKYVKILQQRAHAKLVLYDPVKRRIVGNMRGGAVHPGGIDTKGLSARARNITGDLPADFRKEAMQKSGVTHDIRFLLMLPADAEKQFERQLKHTVEGAGVAWSTVDRLSIRYGASGGGIAATVRQAETDNSTVQIGKTILIW